jgi:hypothetical protein
MKHFALTVIAVIVFTACRNSGKDPSNKTAFTEDSAKYVQVKFDINVNTPTVGMYGYTLITNNLEKDSADARESNSRVYPVPGKGGAQLI